jgi:hypothetical protein
MLEAAASDTWFLVRIEIVFEKNTSCNLDVSMWR